MFIIWGFGRKTTKKFGFMPNMICGRCNNTVQREIMKVTTWFTLFFIPIIPYHMEYYLVCPICRGAQVLSKEEFKQIISDPSNSGNQSSSRKDSDEAKYAGKNPTQIAYLKQMEEVEREKAKRDQN